ncbi:hypothetical protein T492DRAFT_856262 [Pavlovales sp. CCMP2436]|nr:hypothetical protein T492DRAFT_856262 [Pavlovales sp. CCMP2436]
MFVVAQQAVREGGPLALASIILPTASVALALRRLFAPPSIDSEEGRTLGSRLSAALD